MCAVFSFDSLSFKWITRLVVAGGIYTFLHWFLAVPFLYTHFHECCGDRWPKSWIVWFLAASFVVWLIACLLITLFWCCLRICNERHENGSNLRLTGERPAGLPSQQDIELPQKKWMRDSSEILDLPDFNPEGNFTVLQVNDVQPPEESISSSEFPIPVDESCHYVQVEPPVPPELEDQSPKTPREIFFKDLLEAASSPQTFFNFDPEKYRDEEADKEDKTQDKFFIASAAEKDNLTSEILLTLNEKGLVEDGPAVLGQYQVLNEPKENTLDPA